LSPAHAHFAFACDLQDQEAALLAAHTAFVPLCDGGFLGFCGSPSAKAQEPVHHPAGPVTARERPWAEPRALRGPRSGPAQPPRRREGDPGGGTSARAGRGRAKQVANGNKRLLPEAAAEGRT